MSEEKAKKAARTVALSGAIGFILTALLVGMLIGGAVALFVIAPQMMANHQDSNTQGNSGNPNSNSQNGNNNQGSTGTGDQNGNYPSGNNNNNNQGNTNNQNSNQNNNGSQGVNNNNPAPTNPTGQFGSSGCQFSVTIPTDGSKASGTIAANVNCAVQQTGNNIQLALTLTPTMIPQSLSQTMNNSPVTFNFLGTVSGSQIDAQATGTTGPDNASATFDFHLNGSISSNTLTFSITSSANSQLSVSTPQPITLQANA
jgi:hypothetical protein